MTDFAYEDTDWHAIRRLAKWYSGDVHDSLEHLGGWGYLPAITIQSVLAPGTVICGPAITVQYAPSQRREQPQDVYHHAIDNAPEGYVLVVDASCSAGSCSGELMGSGAKVRGAAATVVNGSVRDISQVRELGYPMFARSIAPISVSGRMEPVKSQVSLEIEGVRVAPGDVIFADADGVIVIPKSMAAAVANEAERRGAKEAEFRRRILSGEKLQSVWPIASRADV